MKKNVKRFVEDLIICIGIVVVIIVLVSLAGCCPTKVANGTIYRDSVSMTVTYEKEIIKDTIPYYIPVEVEKVKTIDTMSYLENRWAYSEAAISDGVLTHSLGTKSEPIKIVVDKVIEYRDTTIYEEKIVYDEKVITVEVEKPLSWAEETQIKGFWLMLLVIALFIAWNVFKKKIVSPIATAKTWITNILSFFKK